LRHYADCIGFELTRRCNLHCKWCSKGDAQNMDMTKEIIDKTLDELSDYWIDVVRLTGGEPSLVPELVKYVIDGIIKRRIIVGTVQFITNGTITSDIIKKSSMKFLDYSNTIQDEREELAVFFDNEKRNTLYESLKGKYPSWITQISTWEHDNEKTFDIVKKFYDIQNEKYNLITQEELGTREDIGSIVIEGNAEKIYDQYSENQLNLIRILHNKFCIIEDGDGDKPYLKKTLSVSANGKVYVGSCMSFNHIESNYLFNIMDCNNDFWKKVDRWCWENPISSYANKLMERYKGIKWKYEHHIDRKLNNKDTLEAFEKLKNMIEVYRENLILFHPKLPYLSHTELNLFVVAYLCQELYKTAYEDNEENRNVLSMFIDYTTGLHKDELNHWNKQTSENMMNMMINRNNERAIEKIDNPIKKFFAHLYANM